MWIHFFICILFISTFACISANSQNNIRNYVVRKGFLANIIQREYDVFDQEENRLRYYIEASRFGRESIEIISAQSKKVVGRLKRQFALFGYKAKISVLDPTSNRWIDGTMKNNIRLFSTKFTIEWNGERISMITKIFSYTMAFEFFNEKNNKRVGECQRHSISIFSASIYDLDIFSGNIPDAVFLLAFAVHEYHSSKEEKQQNQAYITLKK